MSSLASAPELSLIIVNWNSVEYLRGCLVSVYAHTAGIEYEVIVIDNASGDGCGEFLAREFPAVRFVGSTENVGFARANNVAYRQAQGEILVFLNPDTEIRENVLLRMAQHLRAHPEAGAAGARLLNSDGSLQTSCIQTYPTILNQILDSDLLRRLFPRSRLWGTEALFAPTRKAQAVDAISGACFVARRQAFEAAGLFTEDYFMYFEDLDLSYKISRAGYRIDYLSDCPVVHHGGRSSIQQRANFVSLRQRESVLQFFRAHRGTAYSLCYRAMLAVAAAARLCLILLATPLGRFLFKCGQQPAFSRWWANLLWALGR
ncbi:MAG: glycosyltransferase family 2 protein [Acidobacteriaceae bacterium]|nr:glycosyltransferase family 2 protein [Acidobacteriaceae bacterium]